MNDDITDTLAPKSDQLDAIDLMGKPPRIFTVTKVDVNPSAEQPVSVHLAEFPRVWRPNVSMRRVLGYCWGTKSSAWIGRQVELYCEDGVKFGPETTGGTRISRLSHIDGPKAVPLLLSKGRAGTWKVQPLPDAASTSPAVSPDTLAELTATFARKGIPEDKWLDGVNHYTKGKATALEVITEEQARHMLTVLADKPDAEIVTDDTLPDPTDPADPWANGGAK